MLTVPLSSFGSLGKRTSPPPLLAIAEENAAARRREWSGVPYDVLFFYVDSFFPRMVHNDTATRQPVGNFPSLYLDSTKRDLTMAASYGDIRIIPRISHVPPGRPLT